MALFARSRKIGSSISAPVENSCNASPLRNPGPTLPRDTFVLQRDRILPPRRVRPAYSKRLLSRAVGFSKDFLGLFVRDRPNRGGSGVPHRSFRRASSSSELILRFGSESHSISRTEKPVRSTMTRLTTIVEANASRCQKIAAATALSFSTPYWRRARTKHNSIVPKKPGVLGSESPATLNATTTNTAANGIEMPTAKRLM